MRYKRNFILLFVFFFALSASGCEKDNPIGNKVEKPVDEIEKPIEPEVIGFDNSYVFYDNDAILKSKLFYFLLALERNNTKQDVINNSNLQLIKGKYDRIFIDFSWSKYEDLPALGRTLLLSEDDILNVQHSLESMSGKTSFKNLLNNHIRPSGKYENYLQLDNNYLIRAIWSQSIAKGINTIIQQYLIGEEPKYNKIDGLKYTLDSSEYKRLVEEQIEDVKNATDTGLFYTRLVSFLIKILEVNDRNEAVRFEPLSTGANQKAISSLSTINWSAYTYSSIVILGDSPNSPGDDVNISRGAKNRIKYAVEAYNSKLAPIIIISGANIYPYQTPYFEAVEMKKWLLSHYDIDEKFIIIDPVARHTTTNLRNASRLIFKYRIPTSKKSLIITSTSHVDYIEVGNFKERSVQELGYLPITIGDRLSDTRLEFTPLIESMHINTLDPLDP